MSSTTRVQAEALATFVRQLRPDWDHPGIVHAITAGIVAAGGNITELQQFSSPDSGHFFTRIEVDGSESDELTRAMQVAAKRRSSSLAPRMAQLMVANSA